MWLDVLALVLLAIFAALGARRGALATGLSLAGLVVGYAVAIYAGRAFGDAAAAAFGVPALFGSPIAGTLAFCLVSFACFVLSFVMRRRGDGQISAASRAGGALFGLARGSFVVLLLGVFALFVDALPQLVSRGASDQPIADTPLRAVTRAAVQAGVATALGDTPGADLAARALSQPGVAMEQLRALVARPEITALAQDQAFWAAVEADSVATALAQPSFRKVQWNPELRRELAALGVVDANAAGDPAAFALEMGGALEKIAPRIRELRSDPDLAKLAADPAVVELVQRRDVVGLLANPAFQQVLSKALAPPST
jgi:uncharacterized membrane protein required for colicin V production